MVRAIIVRQGNKYDECYTKALKRQLKEQGIDALVLGDGPDADVKLRHGYEGWWAKLELFSPDLKAYRPFLYLDLDSIVLGAIPDIDSEKFMMCEEWNPTCHKRNVCQSSMMWIPKEVDYIWESIDAQTIKTKGGDQAWLCQFNEEFLTEKYPYLVGSYKFGDMEEPKHNVVTFHGRPKMKDAGGWAEMVWKAYST